MKYNINILSKTECTLFSTKDLDEDYIIISINDTNCNTSIFQNTHIIDVHKTTFDDLVKQIDGYTLFDSKKATNIKNFIDLYKDSVFNIIVHCTAGISRSGAVGCAIARYLNEDDDYLLKTGLYIPNKLVYKIMCECLGLEYSEELFNKKLNLRYSNSKDKKTKEEFDELFCDVIID